MRNQLIDVLGTWLPDVQVASLHFSEEHLHIRLFQIVDRDYSGFPFSSIAAAVQNGRPIWVSHRTASAMLLRKLC